MADTRKLSVAEMAGAIKKAIPALKDVPDADIVRRVLETRPDLMSRLETSERRPPLGRGMFEGGGAVPFGLEELAAYARYTGKERQREEEKAVTRGEGSPARAAL